MYMYSMISGLSCSFAFRIVCAVITGLAIGVSITLVVMTSVSNKTKRERYV